ncbi:MAG: hypothetical protein J6N21_12910, partial [Butyrivibrio sp.]|nr:hypothetical protein [Butyrivibrio sp.]
MRRIRTLIFLLLCLMIFYGLNCIMTPNWNYPVLSENAGMSIGEFDKGLPDLDVLYIGSSHIEFAISPMEQYKRGIISYNIATSGQPISGAYYFLKELINSGNSPSIVVLDAAPLFSKPDEACYRYITDNVCIDADKVGLVDDYFSLFKNEGSKWTLFYDKISFYIPFLRYHSRWDELGKKDFYPAKRENYFLQGFFVNPYMSASNIDGENVNFVGNVMAGQKQEKPYFCLVNNDGEGVWQLSQ